MYGSGAEIEFVEILHYVQDDDDSFYYASSLKSAEKDATEILHKLPASLTELRRDRQDEAHII